MNIVKGTVAKEDLGDIRLPKLVSAANAVDGDQKRAAFQYIHQARRLSETSILLPAMKRAPVQPLLIAGGSVVEA